MTDCIHRGSKRNLAYCCNMPTLWICRKLNSNCVLLDSEKTRLSAAIKAAGGPEPQELTACESCHEFEHPNLTTLPVSPTRVS